MDAKITRNYRSFNLELTYTSLSNIKSENWVDSRFNLGALALIFMDKITNSSTTVLDRKTIKRKYPEARIIVLDDNFNTFEHVANCLVTIIPGLSEKRSWELAVEVDREGSAEVWRGPLEQAELYHQQLVSKGLTMAPIEKT